MSELQAMFYSIISILVSAAPPVPFFQSSKVSLKKLFATRPHGIAG